MSPRWLTLGTINGGATEVQADVTFIGPFAVPVFVTLLEDYAMLDPIGYPYRPSFTGADQANLQYPRTLPSGTRFAVLQCEATALVNAGAAVLS